MPSDSIKIFNGVELVRELKQFLRIISKLSKDFYSFWCFTMGNNEEGKSSASDKSSPAQQDQTSIHVYPDWAAIQAYYGSRVALPPYYNSGVASGHAPHPYMWGPPQPMMATYGAPYAAIYSHGGVYAHPATVPIGSHPHGPGVLSSPALEKQKLICLHCVSICDSCTIMQANTPLSAETPTKSSGNTDQGLLKKLKGFDGLAMSIGNGDAESAEGGSRLPQSMETEGSSDGSDGNTARGKKRSREGTPTAGIISSFIESVDLETQFLVAFVLFLLCASNLTMLQVVK
ncbi:hypothetical protein NC652_032960 [Populus alba x Populus x berolinensis]|nr:hypothetical protein NC652_032960 [Populus alba x Populus x berolinensis]